MKRHIRYIALLLAVLSLLSLTACASILQAISPTPTLSPTPTATPTPTPTPTATPTPTPTPTPVPALSVDDLQLGYGGPYGYFNNFFGFGMKMPEGWYIYSREDMDGVNGFDTVGKDESGILKMYIDALKEGYLVYDTSATKVTGDDSVMILLLDYSMETLSQHTEFAVMQTMADWAMDYNGDQKSDAKNVELKFVDMLGEEHAVYRYDMKSDGKAMHGAYLVLKQGTTFALIIIDAVDTATIDEILNSFYTV